MRCQDVTRLAGKEAREPAMCTMPGCPEIGRYLVGDGKSRIDHLLCPECAVEILVRYARSLELSISESVNTLRDSIFKSVMTPEERGQ